MKRLFILLCFPLLQWSCSSQVPKTIEQKAAEIHAQVFTVDSHTDTPLDLVRGFDLYQKHSFEEDRSRLDFPRMREGNLDAVFMAAFIGQGDRDEAGNEKAFQKVSSIIDTIHASLDATSSVAELAMTPGDAFKNLKEGKLSVFIGIENGYGIGEDIQNVDFFYQKGARYITLCHTKNNDICDSSTDTLEHGGLSEFGKEVVLEMNRVGMMIDVSHISDQSFYDVLQISKKPVIASHSCARAICDNPRNLDDEMLKALADNGGVIQVCILSAYVKTPDPYPERDSAQKAVREKYRYFKDLTPEESKQARDEWYAIDNAFPRRLASVADMVDHIDHIVKIIGVEHVGIGTDFDGGGGLSDCIDVSQMGNITLELVRRGYTEEDIRNIWGENLMRVMREVQQHPV